MSAFDIFTNLTYPRIVWTYFDRPFTPFISSIITHTNNTIGSSWKINIVGKANIRKFFDLSTFPKHFFSLYPQNQADYIRLRLLQDYGGLWMDASTFITSSLVITSSVDQGEQDKSHLIAFRNYQLCPQTFIENGVMYAPKGSAIIQSWLVEMERLFALGPQSYIHSVYRNGVTLPCMIFRKYPNILTYHSVYACLQYALHRVVPRHIHMTTFDVYDYYYKLIGDCSWNTFCIARKYLNKTALNTYPITKFTRTEREFLDPYYKRGKIRFFDINPTVSDTKQNLTFHCYYSFTICFLFYFTILTTLSSGFDSLSICFYHRN